MATFTNYFTAIALVGLVLMVVALFIGDLSKTYNTPFDNSTTAIYDKYATLSQYSSNISNQTISIDQNPNILDVLGGYYVKGYNVVKTTFESVGLGYSLLSDSITSMRLGSYQQLFIDYLTVILVFVLIMGVVVSAIVRWNL